MRAWLITWSWMGDAAAVVDKVVAILNPRKSPESVAKIVEFLYAQNNSTLAELAAYAKKASNNPYRAEIDFNTRINCGHHPWLSAELVNDLEVTVNPNTNIETITWTTQNVYASSDNETGSKIVSGPKRCNFTRLVSGPVSHELMGGCTKRKFKTKFSSHEI